MYKLIGINDLETTEKVNFDNVLEAYSKGVKWAKKSKFDVVCLVSHTNKTITYFKSFIGAPGWDYTEYYNY